MDWLLTILDWLPPEWRLPVIVVVAIAGTLGLVGWTAIVGVRTWMRYSDWIGAKKRIQKHNCVYALSELANDLNISLVGGYRAGSESDKMKRTARIRARKLVLKKLGLALLDDTSDHDCRVHATYMSEYLNISTLKDAQEETQRAIENLLATKRKDKNQNFNFNKPK